MNRVHYEPWRLLNRLDQLFAPLPHRRVEQQVSRTAASNWTPAVDIREEQDRFVIQADIPGVDPKDIEVQMENGILTIRGQRQSDTSDTRENYRRIERVRGSFQRRLSLPDTAAADAISARSQHGVLEVVIPKQTKVQPRRIDVAN